MSSKVMSIGLSDAPADSAVEQDGLRAPVQILRPRRSWSPEEFAREQIRGLVRQIFFSNGGRIRQVVFSPVDAETDVRRICRRVGEVLALETSGSVALAGEYPQMCEPWGQPEQVVGNQSEKSSTLREMATRLRGRLWLVPFDRGGEEYFSVVSLHSHFCDLRREFEYSIIEGTPAGATNEATGMAQLADGVVLVVSAHRTRRATANNVKRRLEAAQARILGAVLSDRVFPIPEAIYRWL